MKDDIPHFGVVWPPNTPLIQRHNYLAYHNRGNGSFYHRKEIIKALWSTDFEFHFWNERRLQSVCDSNWNTWAGPGGSGKTTDAAVFALQYWLEAPDRTAVIVCSTSMKMLRKRIWAQVAGYHQKLPKGIGPVGELLDSDTMIRWKKGDTKNGIFGMAVEEGPVEEILQNLIGIHTHRVWLILDELQGVREAILKATRNMGKNPVFKFLGMGNPESLTDPLGRLSEPINGWDSIERMQTEHWEIHPGPVKGKGRCDFFDGRKSPACLDLEFAKRNPWMINQEQIDNDLRAARGNMDEPMFMSQSIGWWPSKGIENTVLDEAIIEKFGCKRPAVWTDGFEEFAALDPAFSEGGDRKPLQFGRFGKVSDGNGSRWVIWFGDWMDVPINANSSEPIHYQILNYCMEQCRLRNIKPSQFALDSSGEGGGLKAIFDREWGEVLGVEFGGKPSDIPIGDSGKTAAESYDRRSTELNLMLREFAMSNGLRGLSEEAAKQLCSRKTIFKNGKTHVEKKKDMKSRIGRSPDNADVAAIAVEYCRQRGAVPSSGEAIVNPDWQKNVRDTAQEFSEENYLQAPEWDDHYAMT